MSIVAEGGAWEEVGETEEEEVEDGAKAERSTEAIFCASQVAVMLSGKSGESRTKTSVVERRPRVRALERSSVWRRGPRESALPGVMGGGLATWWLVEIAST